MVVAAESSPRVFPEHYRATDASPLPSDGKFAVLVIDVLQHSCQPGFAHDTGPAYFGSIGNDETEGVATNVAGYCEKARAAGGTIIAIYLNEQKDKSAAPDFYKFQPDPSKGDIIMAKPDSSSFDKTDLDRLLKSLGIDTVILVGVNLSSCVFRTALDSRALGYKTYVVSDLTGNGGPLKQAEDEYRCTEFADLTSARGIIKQMEARGVVMTNSEQPLPAQIETPREPTINLQNRLLKHAL